MSRTFFTDRDLGKRFPAILAAAGIAVEPHAAHFADNTSDEEWLGEIGRRGWIAVTHDRRIRYKPNELAAVKAHSVALLVMVGRFPMPLHADNFVASIVGIERFLDAHHPPLIAKVYRASASELDRNPHAAGRIEHWYP